MRLILSPDQMQGNDERRSQLDDPSLPHRGGMKRKRTEITIETDRMFYISSPRIVLGWCSACDAQVEMVPVDEAAVLRSVSSRTIFQWVEARQVHSSENANGLLMLCLNSLSYRK